MTERAILHVDMDAFFVSVELRARPELVGKPVIVGFPGGRSVVLSASYDCRARGIHSAMPMSQAIPLMPEATVIEPSHHKYSLASAQIMEYFHTLTPLVEQVSIDEAFLDVTGSMRLLGGPVQIAREIRAHIRQEMGLPASVGIAKNKFIAKLASTHAKPDGMAVVAPERTEEFLHDLPVSKMWGVGKRTAAQLQALGIETVGQLAMQNEERLISRLGEHGRSLHLLSRGIDNRAVEITRDEKSISSEHTFAADITDLQVLEGELLRLSHKVGQRLRRHGKSANGVGLKIKYKDFSGITRSKALAAATDSSTKISESVLALLRKLTPLAQPVRLIGVKAERLQDFELGLQFSLDPREEKAREAERIADQIGQKFPQSIVTPARFLRPKE
ncbi:MULTISPECIES: DNA polymerase IV [Glutamicibacter]|uniref:DNA polymerase IV n=1 Tax=Glutamicibacter arilaitensis (strain DSM 16368 / CIP 108037 / IAM 15318 / JCM 13566 / NCIMB 14258 / Re117) TaxID=861360 RepID=A0ABM9PYA9_GLUAR|nr:MULTISPECIES: DNA polymerase IV [Glutamicibacter]CBT76305.1 putative DNA polymerase IV [Glutamicibacter arilaitensis Re117]HCH47824.1 DNA polymerase IV [Glutamicibacter sp.]HCJ54730.1 DNA polymerase IV [Glutamicibacter sp.]HCM94436.1 DNA polymerase IV [Glutamicibacter sp.]